VALALLAQVAVFADVGQRFRAQYRADRHEAVADAALLSSAEAPAHCDLAVVGAGWGGVYSAWRLSIDTQTVKADNVCVFETNGRVGGRIYSIHGLPHFGDLALDVGGYRFIETDLLPASLVWDALKLPTGCYDWQCAGGCEGSANCYVIQDAYGNNYGYSWPIETMLGQIEDGGAGQQVFFGKTLTNVSAAPLLPGGVVLHFSDGSKVSASTAILNMPGNAIANLGDASLPLSGATPLESRTLKSVYVNSMNKVYAYYDDAWWNTKLGQMEGYFYSGSERSSGSENASAAPLSGRYHDGPQKCLIGTDSAGEPIYSGSKIAGGNCSGALEVYYSRQAPYYAKLMETPLQPLTVITETSANSVVLAEVHEALMAYHRSSLRAKGVDPSTLPLPKAVVLSNWIQDGEFTPGIGGMTPSADWSHKVARAPADGFNLYVANQDYGYRSGWAVGSLIMAEKILQANIGIPKPTWLAQQWYKDNILGHA